MKVRLDFITNSSSSCYVCEVCGETYYGWDVGLSEAEMIECEKGHVVCDSHLIAGADEEDMSDEFPDDVLSAFCPICSLVHVRDTDMLDYMLKKTRTKKDMVGERIRTRFVNLEALEEWCDED